MEKVKILPVKNLRFETAWSGEKTIVLLILLALMLAGLVKLVRDLLVLGGRHRFSLQFLEKLNEYIKSIGADGEAYSWLIKRSDRLQRQMDCDESAVIHAAGSYYDSCPVIANMLSELRSSFTHSSFPRANLPGQYGNALIDLIMRHTGEIEDRKASQLLRLVNPFIWLREGIRTVLCLPLTVMHWLGIMSERNLRESMGSRFFRVFSATVTAAGLGAAIMILLTGWQQFTGIISALPRWVKTLF